MFYMDKIAVIGGGPAGLQAALAAAKAGVDVTLFEENRIVNNNHDAEIFFDIMGICEKPEPGIKYKVNQVIIDSGQSSNMINTDIVKLWVVDKREYLNQLYEMAIDNGVTIEEELQVSANSLGNLKSDFDYILDASGVPSVTSGLYNFESIYMKEALFTVNYAFEGDFSEYHNSIKIIPRNKGFAWIYPLNNVKANIGLGKFKDNSNYKIKELSNELDSIIRAQVLEGSIVNKTVGVSPTVIPRKLVYNNIILIGNSAGLSSPLYGSGLDLAQLSARIAVELIKEKSVERYSEILFKKVAVKYLFEKKIRELWFKEDKFVSAIANFLSTDKKMPGKFYTMIRNSRLFWENRELIQEIWNIININGKLSLK